MKDPFAKVEIVRACCALWKQYSDTKMWAALEYPLDSKPGFTSEVSVKAYFRKEAQVAKPQHPPQHSHGSTGGSA